MLKGAAGREAHGTRSAKARKRWWWFCEGPGGRETKRARCEPCKDGGHKPNASVPRALYMAKGQEQDRLPGV